MKYKLSEQPLLLREFGRHLQGLVNHALTFEDRDTRTRIAHEIIRIMITLNPSMKENPEYKQKLWDALFIMSDFKLDVDSPFPKPDAETIRQRPQKRLAYFHERPRLRQYGNHVEKMIAKAVSMPEGPMRSAYLNQIGGTMRLFLRGADKGDMATEDLIATHIRDLSGGKLRIQGSDLVIGKSYSTIPVHNPTPSKSRNNNKRRKQQQPPQHSYKNKRK